jgi:hypothetical protein
VDKKRSEIIKIFTMLSSKVLFLSILLFFSTFKCESLIFEYDGEDYGQQCITKHNEIGMCTEFLKCNDAVQLYQSKKSTDITLCNIIGRIPFVCCPLLPNQLHSSPVIPKTKFQNALCKNIDSFEIIDDHITNGNKAAVAEFPFQVALGYNSKTTNKLEFNCGGSLIADDIVLTAAHCVNKKGSKPVMVRMGRVSLINLKV